MLHLEGDSFTFTVLSGVVEECRFHGRQQEEAASLSSSEYSKRKEYQTLKN